MKLEIFEFVGVDALFQLFEKSKDLIKKKIRSGLAFFVFRGSYFLHFNIWFINCCWRHKNYNRTIVSRIKTFSAMLAWVVIIFRFKFFCYKNLLFLNVIFNRQIFVQCFWSFWLTWLLKFRNLCTFSKIWRIRKLSQLWVDLDIHYRLVKRFIFYHSNLLFSLGFCLNLWLKHRICYFWNSNWNKRRKLSFNWFIFLKFKSWFLYINFNIVFTCFFVWFICVLS